MNGAMKMRNTFHICTYLWHQVFFNYYSRRVKIHDVGLIAKIGEQIGHKSPPIRQERKKKLDICCPSHCLLMLILNLKFPLSHVTYSEPQTRHSLLFLSKRGYDDGVTAHIDQLLACALFLVESLVNEAGYCPQRRWMPRAFLTLFFHVIYHLL